MKKLSLINRLPSILLLISPFILHIALIIKAGFYIYPEFNLYPYLSSHGFLPYKELVDQHFPVLLFGPLSLPSVITRIQSLPTLMLAVVVLTDFFFYLCLLRYKVRSPLLILFIYILTHFYFEGNFLWIDSFITLGLLVTIFLQKSPRKLNDLVIGFLYLLIIALKPTTLPAILLLQLLSRKKISLFSILGFIAPLIITLAYLYKHDLIGSFLAWGIKFNYLDYPKGGAKFPDIHQLVPIVLVSLLPLVHLLKEKRYLYLIIASSLLLLAYPRFELVHLQPYLTVLLLSLAIYPLTAILKIYHVLLLLIISLFSADKLFHYPKVNILTPDTDKIAESIKALPGSYLYVIGGNDVLYSMTNRLPPNSTYIPSLPWYLDDETSQKRIITALYLYPMTPIVFDPQAKIDGKPILSTDSLLYQFIQNNYAVKNKIGVYEIYTRIK